MITDQPFTCIRAIKPTFHDFGAGIEERESREHQRAQAFQELEARKRRHFLRSLNVEDGKCSVQREYLLQCAST